MQKKIPIANTSHIIYFIYREWHTSILLDAKTFVQYSHLLKNPALQKDILEQKFIRIGWGDGDYFTGKSKSFGAATKALVASQYSALQVVTYSEDPFNQIAPETLVALAITDEAMHKLVAYLEQSFSLTQDGEIIPLPTYVQNAGAFYQAREHYSLFSNCNTWSGRALQSAGLPIRSSLHLTAQSIFEQARDISHYQQIHIKRF